MYHPTRGGVRGGRDRKFSLFFSCPDTFNFLLFSISLFGVSNCFGNMSNWNFKNSFSNSVWWTVSTN